MVPTNGLLGLDEFVVTGVQCGEFGQGKISVREIAAHACEHDMSQVRVGFGGFGLFADC
jgi:hypothetical protein